MLRRDSRDVTVGGAQIELTSKEFDLLACFLEHPGIVLSREKLLDLVWGMTYPGGTRTVDVHVAQLRRKLGDPETIRTVRGRGVQARNASMTSLRTRLFRAIALTVVLCVGLTVAVGLVLTRRAVDRATLRDVSHQADLIARSQDVNSTISPLDEPSVASAVLRQAAHVVPHAYRRASRSGRRTGSRAGKPADGSVTLNGSDEFFAARIVSGKPFVLLRPKSVTRSRWTPYVYSLLAAALAGFVLAAVAAFLLARRIAKPVRRVAEAAAASPAAPSRIPCRSRAPPSSRRSRPRSTTSPRSSRARARPSGTSCSRSATS